jgi:transcriptional regulator with XRE-family HTH domain
VVFRKRVLPLTENVFNDLLAIRKKHGVSLETIGRKTKIPIKHLKALEAGSTKILPDILYVKNIIKKYSAFFDIDPRPFIARLEVERGEKSSPQKAIDSKSLVVLPRIIKTALAILITMSLLSYLAYSINKIFAPPAVSIIFPPDKQVVAHSVLTIRGKTEKDAKILINDEQVILDKDNGFNKEINLQKGLNLIKISGVKRYSKERVVWLNVSLEI